MALNTPWALEGGPDLPGRALRQAVQALLGGPVALFVNGVNPTTGGGAHGVIGLDDMKVTAGAGLNLSIAAGFGCVSGSSTIAQGSYIVENDAAVTLPVPAAHATLGRIDLAVLQIRDSAEAGGVDNDAIYTVVEGTPAASPLVPAAPVNSLVLAQYTVLAAATAPSSIIDARPWASAAGGLHWCPSTRMPSGAAASRVRQVYQTDTGRTLTRNAAGVFKITGGVWPAVSVSRTGQSLTSSTTSGTAIAFSGPTVTVLFDDGGLRPSGSSSFVVPAGLGGDYMLSGGGQFGGSTAGAIRHMTLAIGNNAGVTGESAFIGMSTNAGSSKFLSVSKLVRLAAGATVTMDAQQDSGVNLDFTPWMTMHMVRHLDI